MKRLASWIALAALIVVPLAGAIAFSAVQAGAPQSLVPAPVAILQRPSTVTDDGSMDATITATLKPGVAVTAPAWQGGTITRVDVQPGAVVSTGSAVLSIDGVERIAVASPEPFHRALAVGAKGDDVLALEQALHAMGLFDADADRQFDAATSKAVAALEARIGVPSSTGTFDPLWIIWLPSEGIVAQTVDVAVNGVVPSQGATIFSAAPSVDRVTIVGQSAAVDFASGAYVLSQGSDDIATIRADDDVNAELIGRLVAEDDGIDASSIRRYSVRLRREQATTMLSVPAAAVMTGADGTTTCVYGKRSSSDASYAALTVTVSGGSLGVSYLEPTEDLRTLYVLADPLSVMKEPPTCQ